MPSDSFKPTPIANWAEIGKTEHFVQFYQEDEVLVSAVSGYFEGALRANEAAVMIATPKRRKAIESSLRTQGLNLEELKAGDLYFSLDAAETLSKFMVDGLPDEPRFFSTMNDIMSRTSINMRGVRAFGEMVSLLWAQGNREAAISLEEFWNNLAKTYSFALFCAYPLHRFENNSNAAPFVHICRQHSRVITAESCHVKRA